MHVRPKLRTHKRMCAPCSDCVADMYGDVKNNCGMYTPACTGAQNMGSVYTTLTAAAKMQIHLRKHARAMVQQCFRHVNHCDLSCNLSSAQETARFHNSPWRSRICVSTQASSDHTPWCGPHPVCILFAFVLVCRGDHPPQNSISTIFAGFFIEIDRFSNSLNHHNTATNSILCDVSNNRFESLCNSAFKVITSLTLSIFTLSQ